MASWRIREAVADDCTQLVRLIKEMAESEKLSHMVTMTPQELQEDCFGADPFAKCLVVETQSPPDEYAESEKKLIGYGMYFFTYSTFEGRSVYLEDLYVTADYRSRGIGTALWKKIAEIAVGKGCKRLDFITQTWNLKAIKLYESRGATNITTRDAWNLYRLEGEALKSFTI